jgi:predicted phosphoribosyltransferase
MKSFANLADAGRALAALVQQEFSEASDVIVLAAMPNGVPVAIQVAAVLGVRATGLPIDRTGDGPVIGALPDAADRVVIVIDDGVETGSVARAAAIALRELKPRRLVLAVPVCSREAMAGLAHLYDEIIAVDRPLGRRALAWHYVDFDTIDDATATRLLEAQ